VPLTGGKVTPYCAPLPRLSMLHNGTVIRLS
jgi:hypothetical protein